MKMFARLVLITTLLALSPAHALAQTGTTFTYQGSLRFEGAPYTGSADYRFSLWDAPLGGAQLGGPFDALGLDVSEGLFSALIDFGAQAHGPGRFLQIEVRTPAWDGTGDEPAFFAFPDRTALTAAPYALQTRGIFVNEAGDRVGIGTDAPKQALHVAGDSYLRGHLWLHAYEGDGQSGTAYLQARDDSDSSQIGLRMRTKFGGNIIDAMHITPAGLVGIGTNNPQRALEVFGDVRIDGLSASFEIGSSSADTAVVNAVVQLGPNSSIQFPDGSVQSTAYRPIVVNANLNSFTVSNNGQVTLEVNNIGGVEPGMAVIVTPLSYDLWNFHAIAQARVVSSGSVQFRIISNGGGDQTYSPGAWRLTIIP